MNSFPKLSYVCPIPWAELRGDERARFCEKCGRTITNLSELSEEARVAFLAKSGAERACVTYYQRLSGEFVTPEAPLTYEERGKIKQLGLAALSAGALALAAGCVAAPAHPKEDKKQEVQTQASASEETIVLQPFGVMVPTSAEKK